MSIQPVILSKVHDPVGIDTEMMRLIANEPHAPILINGDANFSDTATVEGWAGDGSPGNPFVIEELDITLSGTTPEASINITNTRVHFIVQGCNLVGPAATPSYGIYLENSTNGQIANNMVTNFANGLYVISGCSFLSISDNNVSYNSYSIWLEDSHNLTISKNQCSNNFFTGLHLENSDGGVISGNNCSENGDYGIRLTSFSDENILTENICNNNTQTGIRLQAASWNTFENNTSYGNQVGIQTTASIDNPIHWNIFANNADNILDDGTNLFWDYNYWSDYTGSDANSDGFGDTPYSFGWLDNYPLMFPPFPVEWVETPVDQHVEFGSEFEYSIPVICPAPFVLWVNDSLNFWESTGTIGSSTILAVGDYPLSVNATNIYGYMTEAVFTVIVRDTTPPTLTHPDDISYRVDDDTDHQLEWTLSDLSPLTFVLLRNGTEVTSFDTPTTPIYFTNHIGDDLAPGVYNYTIVAEDIWGNMASDMVLVTVSPLPFLEILLPWAILGVVAVVIVVVIVFLLRKRKTTSIS
jgi:parallel beta-helix repeat protein